MDIHRMSGTVIDFKRITRYRYPVGGIRYQTKSVSGASLVWALSWAISEHLYLPVRICPRRNKKKSGNGEDNSQLSAGASPTQTPPEQEDTACRLCGKVLSSLCIRKKHVRPIRGHEVDPDPVWIRNYGIAYPGPTICLFWFVIK